MQEKSEILSDAMRRNAKVNCLALDHDLFDLKCRLDKTFHAYCQLMSQPLEDCSNGQSFAENDEVISSSFVQR